MDCSIIIPCFNRQSFISEAIESALIQGPDVEVIVVDDGSTDSSWSIIRQYGARISAYRIPNSGVSAARNYGTHRSTAQFIKYLDSDDTIPDKALHTLRSRALKLSLRDIGFGDAVTVNVNGEYQSSHDYGYAHFAPPGLLPRVGLFARTMSPFLPLYPAAALAEIGGFDPTYSLGEDQELAVRLVRAGYRFFRIPTVVNEVRDHSGPRLSRAYGEPGYESLRRLYFHLTDIAGKLEPPLDPLEKVAFAKAIWSAGRNASRDELIGPANRFFSLAEKLAGVRARNGSWLAKLLYNFFSPYHAERMLEASKRTLKSVGTGNPPKLSECKNKVL